MARLVSWAIIILACLGVASLVALPLLAEGAARRADVPPPDALPPDPQLPEKRDKLVVPVDELHEALRLPRVDSTLTDKHSKEALAAYEDGDYEKAFEEAVLSLDPAPLGKNELYRVLTSPDTAKLHSPHEAVERALRPILRSQDSREAAARLNNASALMTLRDYSMGPSAVPFGLVVSQELAAQAADLRPSYCPVLLNLTLYGNAGQAGAFFRPLDFDTDDDLNPAGVHMITTPDYYGRSTLNENYPVEGCNEDPALLYYMAQESVGVGIPPEAPPGSGESKVARAKAFRQIDRLQAIPGWAGLAHSVRGDAYYWFGIYALERAQYKQPFTARRYFKLALTEYDAALRFQPDDTAVHHGKALAYLELGEADEAIREAKTALKAAPDSPRLQQTVIGAYEEKGLYADAAQLNRNSLSNQLPTSPPLSLVPYSAISHGADRYSELAIESSVGAGPAVFIDNDVIVKFVPRGYNSITRAERRIPSGLIQARRKLRHYLLLRDILLSGNYGALNEQLSRAPEEVQDNDRVLLLAGMDSLLNQPQDKVTPTEKTQASIDDFLAATGPVDETLWSSSTYPPGPLPLRANDLFYLEAGNFFRQYKRYDVAIRMYQIWRTELEQAGVDDDRLAEVQRLLGEAHFLKGEADLSDQEDPTNEYDEALVAFEEAARLRGDWPPYKVRQAFMQEKLGKYEAAVDLYRDALGAMRQPTKLTRFYDDPIKYYYPDNYQSYKHLGDVLIRQAAGAERAGSNAGSVRGGYADAARAYRDALMMELKKGGYAETFSETAAPAAVSNLGVTLLKAGSHENGVAVLKTLVRPLVFFGALDDQEARIKERTEVLTALMEPHDVPEQWYKSYEPELPVPDNQNPIFHLNLGWGFELSGEAKKAKEQYLTAVKSDPSFYPALNDLGVMAAEEGNLEEAKKYFYEALNQKSDYAYASHNLGVALLDSGGMGNFLAAQGFLARAADQDSSLAEVRYKYIFDHELNFINLSLGTKVPGDWSFVARAERSALYVSVGAAILILWRIVRRTAYESGRETLFGKIFGFGQERYGGSISRYWARVRDGWLRISRLGSPSRGWWLVTPLALVVSALALVIAAGSSLLWEGSVSRLVMVATLLYVAFVSLLVHHAGHAVVALRSGLQVREAPWLAGLVQAVVLGALSGPFIAPMPATSVEGEAEERRRQLVFFAGPLASIFMAVLLYALYITSHVPLFNFGAVLNAALAAASLLSLPPLEGTEISEGYYTRWAFYAAIFVTVITALIASSGYL